MLERIWGRVFALPLQPFLGEDMYRSFVFCQSLSSYGNATFWKKKFLARWCNVIRVAFFPTDSVADRRVGIIGCELYRLVGSHGLSENYQIIERSRKTGCKADNPPQDAP